MELSYRKTRYEFLNIPHPNLSQILHYFSSFLKGNSSELPFLYV